MPSLMPKSETRHRHRPVHAPPVRLSGSTGCISHPGRNGLDQQPSPYEIRADDVGWAIQARRGHDIPMGVADDYRPDIDGLRAVAVLGVIAFHWEIASATGGFVGVDVFFVISGFLIGRMIYRELLADNFSFGSFYVRRAKRILPALYVVMIVAAGLSWFWLPPPDYRELFVEILTVVVFVSNVLFWSQAGYFDTSAFDKPLLHTWSLSVEEQFYLLFPMLIWGIVKLVRRTHRSPDRVWQSVECHCIAVICIECLPSLHATGCCVLLCEWPRVGISVGRDPGNLLCQACALRHGAHLGCWLGPLADHCHDISL